MLNLFSRWICVGFLSFFLLGCGGKVNQANYDKVSNGMTEAQVEAILGKPTETSSSGLGSFSSRSSVWKSNEGSISIQFLNGKVLAKQFSQGK